MDLSINQIKEKLENDKPEAALKTEYLLEISRQYADKAQTDEAAEYAGKALEASRSADLTDDFRTNLADTAAEAFAKKEDKETAEQLLNELVQAFPSESKAQARAWYHSGYFYLSRNKFEAAREFFQKARESFARLQLYEDLADIVHALGNSHAMQEQYARAAEYYEEAIDIFEQQGFLDRAHKCFLNIRVLHKQASSPKKFLKYCKTKLKEYKSRPTRAYLLQEVALIHNTYGNKKKEEKYLKEAIAAKDEAGITAGLGLACAMLADFYDSRGEEQKAIAHNLRAANLMIEKNELEQVGPVMTYLKHSENEMLPEQKSEYESMVKNFGAENLEELL